MYRITNKLFNGVFCVATIAATVFVNATCSYKLYQEELPEELKKLKKYI